MRSLSLFPLLFCFAAATHAQPIYKWVDAQGKTHYSQNKPEASTAKSREVKVDTTPMGTEPPRTATTMSESDKPAAAPASAPAVRPPPPPATPSRPLFDDKRPEDDATRCEIARKVLNGKVTRVGGPAMDQHDFDVARNDVKAFCR